MRKRMLGSQVSVCTHLAELSSDASRLCFTWAIAHQDDFGRLTADPARFRATVVPLLEEITVREIGRYLREWEKAGLVRRYAVEGCRFMEMRAFEKYNGGLKRSRSGRSR